jgi:hypothetical protein
MTKCTRSACKTTTGDPMKAGWPYIELPNMPLRLTGYYCPPCADAIHELHRQAGVEPKVQPDRGAH